MATVDGGSAGLTPHQRLRPTTRQGIGAIAATYTLDAVSTVAGLTFAPILVEQNPVARTLFAHLGIVETVVVLSILAGAVVIAVTETASRRIRERTGHDRFGALVRLFGYGIPSVVSLFAATNNLVLLVTYAN